MNCGISRRSISSCMARWAEEGRCRFGPTHKARRWARRCCEWSWMSMSTNLLVSREGRTRRLTLNRPAKRNALDMALCRDLVLAMKEAESDPGAGAILIDANGPDFCAGMDLSEALSADVEAMVALHLELFSLGSRMVKPVGRCR